MKPVLEKNKFGVRHVVYIIIVIICVIAIGIGVYMQFFKDEKLGVIFGITEEKEDQEIKKIKENFLNSFSNNLEIIQDYSEQVVKIKEDMDIIITAKDFKEQKENYIINMKMPYFNIKTETAIKMNQSINKIFMGEYNKVQASDEDNNTIFNVKYRAFLNDEFLSLIILSELKERDDNQRIIIKTYNYNLKENKEIKIEDFISSKNIDATEANKQIRETIDYSQKESLKLQEMGYAVNVRDSNSAEYKIENAKYFILGENGYLYIIYPYGNKEYTSEMDLVIFK